MQTISKLFRESEITISQCLEKLSGILDAKFGLIKFFERKRQYYDEPKFWYFSALINNKFFKHDGTDFHTYASGISFFLKEEAHLKCLAESIERYCNFIFLKKSVSFTGSIKQLKRIGYDVLEPNLFARYSFRQLQNKSFKHFNITENSKLRWTRCVSLIDGKSVMTPCQFIYLSYPLLPKEPILYPSISTGVAGGSCLSGALVRGIYEIIERDAFMIYYLNKLPAAKIKLNSIKEERISKFLQIAKRYKMEIISLDITTDIGIPVVASIIIDRTGIGMAVSVGLKSHLNSMEALIGSITEAFHTRGWIREEYEKNLQKITIADMQKNSNLLTRGLFWYPVENIKHLDFWLKSSKIMTLQHKNSSFTSGQQLEYVFNILKQFGYNIYWKDLMFPKLKDLKYFVVKVIIPQFQPLYLNERYPLLGGKRLYQVPEKLGFKRKDENEFNTYPHPFL